MSNTINPFSVPDFSSSPDSRSSAPIDLKRVRRLFSRPEKVIESNFLRREIAGRMRERLELVKIAPERILDAGCGEGGDIGELLQLFPSGQVIGVDASFPMLQTAHGRQVSARSSMNRLLGKWIPGKMGLRLQSGAELVCSDFACLPLAANTIDLMWSNLALHWHPQPDQVFAEWRRILRVDGLLMFSCFGPDTFKELRDAFSSVNKRTVALPFVDMHDFGDMLVHAGFSTPVMDMEKITVTYDTVEKLVSDVRAWGGNPLSTRLPGLLGKQAWGRVRDELEAGRRTDGKIPLSFEIIYGHAFRPIPKKTAAGESIIRFEKPKK